MSSLNMYNRPVVKFDPANAEHRKWLGEFTTNLSWGNCPVRFTSEGYGNTVAQMQQKLIEYYISQEFNK